MPENFGLATAAPLSIVSLLINLGVGVVLSILLRWHFKYFSSTLTNRSEFSHVCPFILLTTILIITVVKSSLALSLGLVGALSIVRFRTPIKEPEELAYLFIAIAIGLGLGADQTKPTIIAAPLILFIMGLLKWSQKDSQDKNLYLSIDLPVDSGSSEQLLNKLNESIAKHVVVSDLRRVDSRNNSLEATYYIDVERSENLSLLIDELNQSFSGIGVTFIDQSRIPAP